MRRITVVSETYRTKAGDVTVEMDIEVRGSADGVAQVDRDLMRHLRERPDGSMRPLIQKVNGQTVPEFGETAQAFERALRLS